MADLALQDVYTSTDASPAGTISVVSSSASAVSRYLPILSILSVASALATAPLAPWLAADHGTPVLYADISESRISNDLLAKFRTHIESIQNLLTEFARTRGISVSDATVSTFVDPEEHSEEIVITQDVRLPADAALAYWDEAGAAVAEWTRSLPADEAERVNRTVAVAVHWTDG